MTVRLAFGYLAVNPRSAQGRDVLADRPRIPAPPPGAGDPATDIEGSPPFRPVTFAPVPGVVRALAAAAGVAVLYGMLLAGTAVRLDQALADRVVAGVGTSPGKAVSRVLWAEPQPEAVAAQAGADLVSAPTAGRI
jgi:hypothetical protein